MVDETKLENRLKPPQIAILGAGFSGLAMAIQLKNCGVDNFTIYEKADDVGGTWRENTYPGVACDIPSHLYSLSYEPNPDWSRRYSRGREIWDYMKRCAEKHGLYPRIRFNREVKSARHDGGRWRIEFADGARVDADIVVSGLGGLHHPHIPDFPGKEDFAGPAFHTAQWRRDVDLAGKRVAVIGSAASAVQAVPAIATKVARLDLYQRTPNWIFPRNDYAYPGVVKKLFAAAPFLARAYRGFIFSIMELRFMAFKKDENYMKRHVRRIFSKHLKNQVADPELRRKLTPDFPVGCKRILVSDEYLPAVQRDNVDIVTAPIERIERAGVRTKDGVLREVDAIVFATGFRPFDISRSVRIVGPSGVSLADAWKDRIAAHRTVAAPGFPNFFLLLGPNSGLGHNSVLLMIEAQVKYVISLIEAMRREGAAFIEPDPHAADSFDRALQDALQGMVWAGGCKSWYLDEAGRNYTLYAYSVRRFLRDTAKPRLDEYVLKPAHETAAAS
ncbi:MAG: flavin-containing monooxygenase [Parvularculaceae bacterium]